MKSRKIIEGLLSEADGKKPKVDTPYAGSWADQEAHRPKQARSAEDERLMRAGIVEPSIQKAIKIGEVPITHHDDYGAPVGPEGQRRFATCAPGNGGGGPGSTSGVLLGRQGYARWARDMRERGETVPSWEEGKLYSEESVTPNARAQDIVDRLIEAQDG